MGVRVLLESERGLDLQESILDPSLLKKELLSTKIES